MNRTAITTLTTLLASASLAGITGLAIPARSQTQTPSPAEAAAAAPAPAAAVDTSNLNPAFFLTPAQVERAIKNGRDLAKKEWSDHDFLAKNGKNPVGIRGEKGVAHDSFVVCDTLDGLGISRAAFDSAINYKTLQLPPGVDEHSGATAQTLDFDILLESDASVDRNGTILREAQSEDVKATRFVLTDDQGHTFDPGASSVVSDVMHGTKAVHGTHSSITASSESVFGTDRDNSHSVTTTYAPWSQSHTYYTASYRVSFPAFGKDGKAVFTPATKRVTLHILTEFGERTVDFDLKPPKK